MSRSKIAFGEFGEDLACRELERRGYAILARRYRIRAAEIDIVATDRGTLVFVEVKSRDGRAFGEAAEAVTWHKRRRLIGAAQHFVAVRGLHDRPCRFDVVAVHVEDGRVDIQVFQNAFSAH